MGLSEPPGLPRCGGLRGDHHWAARDGTRTVGRLAGGAPTCAGIPCRQGDGNSRALVRAAGRRESGRCGEARSSLGRSRYHRSTIEVACLSQVTPQRRQLGLRLVEHLVRARSAVAPFACVWARVRHYQPRFALPDCVALVMTAAGESACWPHLCFERQPFMGRHRSASSAGLPLPCRRSRREGRERSQGPPCSDRGAHCSQRQGGH